MENFSLKRYYENISTTLNVLNQNSKKGKVFLNHQGFGNIVKLFQNDTYREGIINLLQENYPATWQQIVSSLKKASLNSYFTPNSISETMVNIVSKIPNFNPTDILEPSSGNGIIVKNLVKQYPNSNFIAFEKDILTSYTFEFNFSKNNNVQLFGIPFENIENTDAPKKYDLVMSNIPFGSTHVFDPSMSKYESSYHISKNIHSYFFFKASELLKENGIIAFISTKNFLDKAKYDSIRSEMLQNVNFIGAIRLPNNTFKTENTSVVTDLIFLQSNKNKIVSQKQEALNELFRTSTTKIIEDNEVQFSKYFEVFSNNIIGELEKGGMYDNKDYSVSSNFSIKEISNKIESKFLSNIRLSSFNLEKTENKSSDLKSNNTVKKTRKKVKVDFYSGNLNPGSLVFKDGKIAKIKHDKTFSFIKVKNAEIDKISKIIALRDSYFEFINNKEAEKQKMLQENFNYLYDAFVFQYGNLHDPQNRQLVAADLNAPIIFSFEKYVKEKVVKADVFTRTIEQKKELKFDNLDSAVLSSINLHGSINLKYLEKVLNRDKSIILKEGINSNILFLNPNFDKEKIEIVQKSIFFSGNISKKISFYEKANFGDFSEFIQPETIEKLKFELEKIKPSVTKFEDLSVLLHEPWMDLKIVEEFVKQKYNSSVSIFYNKSSSKYMVDLNGVDSKFTIKFIISSASRRYGFKHLLEAALNQTIPNITYKDPSGKKHLDVKVMQKFKVLFKVIYQDFNDFVLTTPRIKKNIEYTFYQKFEAHVKPKFNGDFIKYKGLENFKPYDYQKNTTAGIITNEGILAHKQVGFGKTLAMIISAMKLKELGISNKTLIIGLKSTIVQLEKEFYNAFPLLKLATGNSVNTSNKQKREEFFADIINNDYDVVLMSHDTFKFIPQSAEISIEIIKEELDNVSKDLEVALSMDKAGVRAIKGLEVKKENLEVALKYQYDRIDNKKDNSISFDAMGIQHIMVDESHSFKNLMYTTRHYRVAGLNTNKGSQKSTNLLTTIRTLQRTKNKDFQASFFSGTPISNSIVEAYVIFKYLIPNKLKELNISSFDQWAQVFAEKSFDFEPTVNGKFKLRERFRVFKKLKQLASLYSSVSTIVNDQTHHVDKPEKNFVFVKIEPSDNQVKYFEDIKKFIKSGDSSFLHGNKEYKKDQLSAISLIALNQMRLTSIDPRLINPDLPYESNSKLEIISDQIAKRYQSTNHFKGTQVAFSDIGTPGSSKEFDVYSELKRILIVRHNIPKNEIEFIHNFKNDEKRKDLFKRINSGNVRVIIGSTSKLGTGTNFQERLIAVHHINIPYRPSDIDQRNGRAARKKNIFAKSHYNNKVDILFYPVKNSTDTLMINTVNTKSVFIKQVTSGTIKFNKMDTGPVSDNGEIDYKTLLAATSGNSLFLEKEDINSQIKELVLDKQVFLSNKRTAEHSLYYLDRDKQKKEEALIRLKNVYNEFIPLISKDDYYKEIEINNQKNFKSEKQIGGEIRQFINRKIELYEKYKTPWSNLEVASFKKAKLIVYDDFYKGLSMKIRIDHKSYYYGSGKIVKEDLKLGQFFKNTILQVEKDINQVKDELEKISKNEEGFKEMLKLEFNDQNKLDKLEERLNEINQILDKESEKEISKKVDQSQNDNSKNKNSNEINV